MKNEGYLFVDHRASPGLPEDVARRNGLDPQLTREGKIFEAATLTCAHCKTVVIINPGRTRERGRCWKCAAYICDNCSVAMQAPGYEHRSFQDIVDSILEKGLKNG